MIIGIVVQNNDPQKRGRVKVFVPRLSLNVYSDWDDLNEEKTFEKLSDPKIKVVIDGIKNQLPWANCAAPIFGETGNHYYDAYNKKSTVGDSVDKTTDKPAKTVETSSPTDTHGNTYTHNAYSNSAKGLFSIPKVGSRVWIFFENGNLNRPVYFATAYSKGDWESISEDNYPDKLENYSTVDGDEPDSTYTNKVVVSQRGGVIEIINTDNEESLQISHYNGSFKLWANSGNKEYVNGDDATYVTGKSDLHIGGNMNVHIDGDATITATGNYDVTAPNINLHGNIMLDGPLTQGTTGSQGATLNGPVVVTNDVTAGGISLITHVHGGVDSGPSNTGVPI